MKLFFPFIYNKKLFISLKKNNNYCYDYYNSFFILKKNLFLFNFYSTKKEMEQYLTPKEQPIFSLKCENAFKSLTLKEKKYAHFISQGKNIFFFSFFF